jgi:hypothetical protein
MGSMVLGVGSFLLLSLLVMELIDMVIDAIVDD